MTGCVSLTHDAIFIETAESCLLSSWVKLGSFRGVVHWLTYDGNNPELRSGKWLHEAALRFNFTSQGHLHPGKCRPHFLKLLCDGLPCDRRAG
jgi:hypothetical protein